MMNTNEIEMKETFDNWKFVMDDAIPEFLAKLPENLADILDFSLESLLPLEGYLLKHFTPESIKEKENAYWLDGFVRYAGRTFTRNIKGARWEIQLEEKYIYYGLPVITGGVNQVSDYCIHMDIVTALHRKKGNFLHFLLEKAIERQK